MTFSLSLWTLFVFNRRICFDILCYKALMVDVTFTCASSCSIRFLKFHIHLSVKVTCIVLYSLIYFRVIVNHFQKMKINNLHSIFFWKGSALYFGVCKIIKLMEKKTIKQLK